MSCNLTPYAWPQMRNGHEVWRTSSLNMYFEDHLAVVWVGNRLGG